MSNIMDVLLNGVAQLEYDRDKPLTDLQKTYLSNMSSKMDGGIEIGGQFIENPKDSEKMQFVVANLLVAMKSDSAGLSSALCTYLADAMPELKQIKIDEADGEVSIEFIVYEDAINKDSAAPVKH